MKMGALRPIHWVIIVIVVAILLMSRRLPDIARSLGRSMRILKSEVDELKAESAENKAKKTATTAEESVADSSGSPLPKQTDLPEPPVEGTVIPPQSAATGNTTPNSQS